MYNLRLRLVKNSRRLYESEFECVLGAYKYFISTHTFVNDMKLMILFIHMLIHMCCMRMYAPCKAFDAIWMCVFYSRYCTTTQHELKLFELEARTRIYELYMRMHHTYDDAVTQGSNANMYVKMLLRCCAAGKGGV